MYFLFFIFFMELLFSELPKCTGTITGLIGRALFTVSDDEKNIRSEIEDLKQLQSGLSVTDDFAKYAKLQRSKDKLMNQLKAKANERKGQFTYLRMIVSAAIYFVHAVIIISLMFNMNATPLLTFPEAWFSPLNKMLAFPTGISGALGLGCWVGVSNSVISRVKGYTQLSKIPLVFKPANTALIREPELD